MFPVTLEFHHDLVTVLPPCYGFLKKGHWDGGVDSNDDDDDDDDYYGDDSVQYEATPGKWQIEMRKHYSGNYTHSIFSESADPQSIVLGDNYNLSDLKYIWNSGTHLPVIGITHSGAQFVQFEENMEEMAKLGEPLTSTDNVRDWASKNNRPDVTTRAFMELLSQWVDKDRDSCLVWHSEGFMGVDASVAADRCLFYLMVNRAIHDKYEKSQIYMMLDLVYKEEMSPVNALILSRIIAKTTNVLGIESVIFVGHDYDSCVLPFSLITTGIGKFFLEPVQVPWRQKTYVESEGHERDQDFSSLSYYGGDLRVNNSMFLPLLHPHLNDIDYESANKNVTNPDGSDAVPIGIDFVKAIALDAETKARIMYNRHIPTRLDLYRLITTMTHDQVDREGSGFNVIPSNQWIDIFKNLLLK